MMFRGNENFPTIRIEVALPPARVLEQLASYGKDWRESRLPPEARGVNFSLKVQGGSFELQLLRLRGPEVIWRGSVVDAEARGGSLVTAVAQPVRTSLIGWLLMAAVAFGIEVWGHGVVFTLILVLVALALTLALELLTRAGYAGGEVPLCRAILLRAMQATPASSSG